MPNFIKNKQFWFSETNLPINGVSGVKQRKVNITIEWSIFELVQVPSIILNVFNFSDQICPKMVFAIQKGKVNFSMSELAYQISF